MANLFKKKISGYKVRPGTSSIQQEQQHQQVGLIYRVGG